MSMQYSTLQHTHTHIHTHSLSHTHTYSLTCAYSCSVRPSLSEESIVNMRVSLDALENRRGEENEISLAELYDGADGDSNEFK